MDCQILTKCALFRNIPEEDLSKLIQGFECNVRTFEKGETVFRFMGRAESVGIVLEGSIAGIKPFPDGSEMSVTLRRQGDLLGQAAAFSAMRRYPCDLVANERSKVLILKREELLSLMRKDSRVMESFIIAIASVTYMLQRRLELTGFRGIAQKAAFWLLMKSEETGQKKVMIPGSVSNWASVMNVSRPSLHRELRKMEENGLISYALPEIEILDPQGLRDLLG